MSAKARFFVPLLWAVKMESLPLLEGRERPVVGVEEVGADRREESVEVKAMLLVGGADLEDLGRGSPYKDALDVIARRQDRLGT